jgi:hypothetical protein
MRVARLVIDNSLVEPGSFASRQDEKRNGEKERPANTPAHPGFPDSIFRSQWYGVNGMIPRVQFDGIARK